MKNTPAVVACPGGSASEAGRPFAAQYDLLAHHPAGRPPVAVIPAAGLGTRMRPASAAVPKELLPVGGRPAIDWILDELRRCAIERVLVVTSPLKPAIESYLSNHTASRRGDRQGDSSPAGELDIELVVQRSPRGLGDAILVARQVMGRGPMVVMLPDELMLGRSTLLESMLTYHRHRNRTVVGLLEVPRCEIGSYGCAEVVGRDDDGALTIASCVEKPDPLVAPSNMALCGRYVLHDDALDALSEVAPDHRGEVQLTPALDAVARRGRLDGIEVQERDVRVDVGSWPGWLEANQFAFGPELALREASFARTEPARIP